MYTIKVEYLKLENCYLIYLNNKYLNKVGLDDLQAHLDGIKDTIFFFDNNPQLTVIGVN